MHRPTNRSSAPIRVALATALLAALAAPLAPASLAAQAAPPVPIARVLADGDADFVPDALGSTVTVRGIATQHPFRSGNELLVVTIQDETSGIRLVSRRDGGLLDAVRPGDMVEARGVLHQYRGAEEIKVRELRRTGTRALPEPRDVLAADLHGERHASRLVRIHGELSSRVQEGPRGPVRTFELRDRSGRIQVFFPRRFLEGEGAERLLEGGPVELVAIASQYASEPPYDDGYQLTPREPADVRFVPRPPVLAISLAAAFCALAALALYVARRRRAAERRAAELERLNEELRRVDAVLQESEQRHRLLFARNPLPMWLYDVETLRVLEVNDAAVARYGYAREEFLALTIDRLLPEEDVPKRLATRAAPGAGRREFEVHRHRTKDGTTLLVEAVSDDAWTSGRPSRLVLALDVTDRERLEAQLRHAQKMEAVGQLAGGVAHDFNNMLTIITAYSAMLLKGAPEDAPMRADLLEIKKAADRAVGLTRQLLAFSRKQVLQPRVLQLDALVAELDVMLRRLVGERIRYVTTIAPELGLVRADPGQLEQVIVNLAVNARDAMPDGGTLTLDVANVELRPRDTECAGGTLPPGAYVVLSVSDTGHGMDAATQARIFEPFFTTKEVGKGTGLGLATVYGTVRQSEGHIVVQSEPGRGARFRVYLPRLDAAEAPEPAHEEPEVVPRGSETVLLVEDEEGVRRLASRVLAQHGYAVLEARHGRDALEVARAHEGRIDLLVTDVVMPEMNGRALAEVLGARHPELRVLYMSGYTDEIFEHGLIDPDVAFLQKPFAAERLAVAVREVLDGPLCASAG